MRINKYIAACGICSRRAAENLIVNRRVKINGVTVTDLSVQVGENDKVEADGKVIKPENRFVYIILNKPCKCVTTCSDEKHRTTVIDILQRSRGDKRLPQRVFPVGRLDYDTEGLLLLTNDGDFARKVMHPSFAVKKTYTAVVEGVISTLPQADRAVKINDNTVEITIHEGKNRQVRKMLADVGLNVISLKRISVGGLGLGNLKSGEWKFIEKPFDI